MSVRLLSINIWDLPIPLPGHDRWRRRRRLLEQLPRLDPDLLLVQEAFRPAFKLRLAAAFPDHVADALLRARRRAWLLPMDGSGGLLLLSRWPIRTTVYLPFRRWRGMKPDERVGRKGVLWCEVDTPEGRILIGNVHLYAGAGAREARVRTVQTRILLRQLERRPQRPTVVAGDFNMSAGFEQADPSGLDLMAEAGFHEVAGGRSEGLATMAPGRNRYARYVPWHSPDRRLTQVFVRGLGVAEAPRVCLDDPPVSDHFGLLVGVKEQEGERRKESGEG